MLKQEYIAQFYKQEKWNLFQHPKWWDALVDEWDVVRIEYKSTLVYLAFSIEKKWGVRILRNPHLIPYLVPLSTYEWTREERSQIASQLLESLPKVDVLNIDLSPDYTPSHIPNLMEQHSKRTNYLDLMKGQAVYDTFKPALRRQIKKAELNLTVTSEDNIEAFIQLHQKTFDKQNTSAHIAACGPAG